MEDYFNIKNVHCEGKTTLEISAQGDLFTMGSDNIITHFKVQSNTNQAISLQQPKQHYYLDQDYQALRVHPVNTYPVALMRRGNNSITFGRQLQYFENGQDTDKKGDAGIPVFESATKINDMAFSPNGEMLGVGSEDLTPIIYSLRLNKKVKCRPAHSKPVTTVFWSPDSTFFCSVSEDGNLKVFLVKLDTVDASMIFSTNLNLSPSIKDKSRIFLGAYNPSVTVLVVPGKPNLQEFSVSGTSTKKHEPTASADLKVNGKMLSAITVCAWVSDRVLVTVSEDESLNIWNYTLKQNIVSVEKCGLTSVAIFGEAFYGVDNAGRLSQFSKPELLQPKSALPAPVVVQPAPVLQASPSKWDRSEKLDQQDAGKQAQDDEKLFAQIQDQQNLAQKQPQKQVIKNKLQKLVPKLPQDSLRWNFDIKNHQRFLYFNSVGCVVQTLNNQDSIKQFQLHNSSIINTRKEFFKDKEAQYLCIQPYSLKAAYATDQEFGFADYEPELLGDSKPNIWERSVENIQGIVMGSEWIAVLTYYGIQVYDFQGDHTDTISFDKMHVAAAGYENQLAVVYHDGVPLYGDQCLRMKIFEIKSGEPGVSRAVSDVLLPLSSNSELTYFDYSQQGMLVSQDSTGRIQAYLHAKAQWSTIFVPPSPSDNIYKLVYVRNYKLYGFVLPENDPEPTVLPRSKIQQFKVSVPVTTLQTINPESNPALFQQQIAKLDTMYRSFCYQHRIFLHEQYRNRAWFQYRFARSKKSPYYKQSASILSDEELQQRQTNLDKSLLSIVGAMVRELRESEKAFWLVCSYIGEEGRAAPFFNLFNEAGETVITSRLQKHFAELKKIIQIRNRLANKRISACFKPGHQLQRNLYMLPHTSTVVVEPAKKRTKL